MPNVMAAVVAASAMLAALIEGSAVPGVPTTAPAPLKAIPQHSDEDHVVDGTVPASPPPATHLDKAPASSGGNAVDGATQVLDYWTMPTALRVLLLLVVLFLMATKSWRLLFFLLLVQASAHFNNVWDGPAASPGLRRTQRLAASARIKFDN
eukprot:TRINITY_DN13929_c0_g1_i4.p1 TRINITY_DN13929_c0_g1~~TRINITY_DN13929_c0_g1_i4.p1  ORF type:complete len:163 (-),score=31.06 TRINITY_DN13929_c0_g1_i4:193-648(-)